MSDIPCGKTLGYGETCCEGHLCDSCSELTTLRELNSDLMNLVGILADKRVWDFSHREQQRLTHDGGKEELRVYNVYCATVTFAVKDNADTPWAHFAKLKGN